MATSNFQDISAELNAQIAAQIQATNQAQVSLGGTKSSTPPPPTQSAQDGSNDKASRRKDPITMCWGDLENGDRINDTRGGSNYYIVTDAPSHLLDQFDENNNEIDGNCSWGARNNEQIYPEFLVTPHPEAPKEEWVELRASEAKVGMKMRYRKNGLVWEIIHIENLGAYEFPWKIYRQRNGRITYDVWHDSSGGGWLMAAPEVVSPRPGGISFDSVILPEDKKRAITHAIKQVDHHDLIFTEWGFADTFEKGTAISMLFWGEPGTGKTLMAQAIADRYDYQLKVISTAEIETPEPGGAERAIQTAFREAAQAKTVLLFDECDGLISSRKHMGSILAAQVNCLLTELEHYTGVVIFTTNRVETLDEAFERRLSLKLEFEMPDPALRAQIWARMFPQKAPLAKDVDFTELAEVEIAGGHIKNIVLQAARMAANQDVEPKKKQITQDILITALAQEVEGMNKFKAAKENDNFYGTQLSQRQRDVVMSRGRGKLGIDRG